MKHFGINSIDELPKPREIEEILKDDDMADHRQFLVDRQLELEDLREKVEEEESEGEVSEAKLSLLEAVEEISPGEEEEENESPSENSNGNSESAVEDSEEQ